MQYLAILGRQPKISLAEIESLFANVSIVAGSGGHLALFDSKKKPNIARLGGVIKLGRTIDDTPEKFLLDYVKKDNFNGKFTIGVSDYSPKTSGRTAQGEALHIKRLLKKHGMSVRVVPNKDAVLSSATVFHNQLGEKRGRFEFIRFKKDWYVGLGVQNINAYMARDQKRPARDAKNGMLPPKLAQILINLCGPLPEGARVLDPFCGTGVVLQEALLMGYKAYGTDINERIVSYAKKNLDWLKESSLAIEPDCVLSTADATDFDWEQPIDAVAFEGYLGPPMSTAPAEIKLKEVRSDLILLYRNVLRNLSRQIHSGVPVVMAVPAWLRPDGSYQRLNLLDEIDDLGYNVVKYKNLSQNDLLYFREGQVVAREIIVLRKK